MTNRPVNRPVAGSMISTRASATGTASAGAVSRTNPVNVIVPTVGGMTSGVDGALGELGEPPPQLRVVNRPMTTTKGWRDVLRRARRVRSGELQRYYYSRDSPTRVQDRGRSTAYRRVEPPAGLQ